MGAKVANNVSNIIEFGRSLGGYHICVYVYIHVYILVHIDIYMQRILLAKGLEVHGDLRENWAFPGLRVIPLMSRFGMAFMYMFMIARVPQLTLHRCC